MSNFFSKFIESESNLSSKRVIPKELTKCNTAPDISTPKTSKKENYSPISPLLNIYLGLPSPFSKSGRNDPFDKRTPFHEYLEINGRKNGNGNYQNSQIEKSLLKKTSESEKALQLFALILRFERTAKAFEKPSILSLMLDIVKENVNLCDELCCQLLKQLMNNNSGSLNVNWALTALLLPYLKLSEDVRHILVNTLEKANASPFDNLISEIKSRVIRQTKGREIRPCAIEIVKYEVVKFYLENRK